MIISVKFHVKFQPFDCQGPGLVLRQKTAGAIFFFSKFVMNCDHRSDESGASIALKSLAERGRIFQVEKKSPRQTAAVSAAAAGSADAEKPHTLLTTFQYQWEITSGGLKGKTGRKRKESFVNKSSANGSGKMDRRTNLNAPK